MAVSWRDSALLAAPAATTGPRPSRWQALALLGVLVIVAGSIATVSYLVRPDRARAFALFHGSLFLSDSVAPVAVDLASGRPTVRLVQAAEQVGTKTTTDLAVTPLQDGTLLLDRQTGEFNMVAATGFVVKTTGGVPIAGLRGSTGAVGIASGQQAFIEQTGPTGTAVYLVSESTVQTAGVATGTVRPRAVRSMAAAGSTAPGATASADGDLWMLVGSGTTRTVRRLHLPADSSPGVTLASSDHGTRPGRLGDRGHRYPWRGSRHRSGGGRRRFGARDPARHSVRPPARSVSRPSPAPIPSSLPREATRRLAFLIHGTDGWNSVSVAANGSDLRGPTKLADIAPDADLAHACDERGQPIHRRSHERAGLSHRCIRAH